MSRTRTTCVAFATMVVLEGGGALLAQTAAGPSNVCTRKDDVEIGLEAARVVERRLPVLRDETVSRFLDSVVHRLVAAIPPELQYPEFEYRVTVIDLRQPHAYALPGGPIYVNRGLMESARTSGELAGAVAHEIAHIALRHGTARATRETEFAFTLSRALLAALEGRPGGIRSDRQLAEGAAALLRFGPECEREADVLGLRIMTGAGYDPRDMSAIGGAVGGRDRDGPTRDRAAFERARVRLRGMGRATTFERMRSVDIEPAWETGFTTHTERNLFRVRVPADWRGLADGDAVVFTPAGGYGEAGGQAVFTHGIEIGLAPREGDDLRRATAALIDLLASDNPSLRQLSDLDRSSLASQPAVRAVLSNASEVTGQEERMEIVTTLFRDGRLFYALVVAPRRAFASYEPTFQRVISSIAIIE